MILRRRRAISNEESDHRRPVWGALSELFLDTSLDSTDLQRIAQQLARLPYSVDELDRILLWEVYPACGINLFSIAGEWAYFDPEWLKSRIRQGPSLLMFVWTSTLGRVFLHSSVDWKRIKRHVIAARESAA